MIVIDTNVLLRYLLCDDAAQTEVAKSLIQGADKVLITDVVLVETVWTLTGKKYQLDKSELLFMLNLLFEEPNIVFENDYAVWCAVADFANASPVIINGKKKMAGFQDALIINRGKQQKNYSDAFSFDVAAEQLGFKVPT